MNNAPTRGTWAYTNEAIAAQLDRMKDRDPSLWRGDLKDMLASFTVMELVVYLHGEGQKLWTNRHGRARIVDAVLDIHTPEVASGIDYTQYLDRHGNPIEALLLITADPEVEMVGGEIVAADTEAIYAQTQVTVEHRDGSYTKHSPTGWVWIAKDGSVIHRHVRQVVRAEGTMVADSNDPDDTVPRAYTPVDQLWSDEAMPWDEVADSNDPGPLPEVVEAPALWRVTVTLQSPGNPPADIVWQKAGSELGVLANVVNALDHEDPSPVGVKVLAVLVERV